MVRFDEQSHTRLTIIDARCQLRDGRVAQEVVWRTADSSALRIYSTPTVTNRRIPTLLHDPQYRVAIAWQNTGYNQPPHPSFFIGDAMATPPQPKVFVA